MEEVRVEELLREKDRSLEKYRLIKDAYDELFYIGFASQKDLRKGFADSRKIGNKTPTFSECYSSVRRIKERDDVETLASALRPVLKKYCKTDSDILDPSFEFSQDPGEFFVELGALTILLFNESVYGISSSIPFIDQEVSWHNINIPEKDDPRLDLAIMKALFHAGKMIERLKHEGMRRSDVPAKAGGTPRKGYVDPQSYSELFYLLDVGNKSRNNVCERIMTEATKREQARAETKNETPKKVKSIKWLREKLKPELDKLFP